MGMKNLSYFTFVIDQSNYGQVEIVRDKLNELILPRRSEFKFDINCDTFLWVNINWTLIVKLFWLNLKN